MIDYILIFNFFINYLLANSWQKILILKNN